MALEGSFRNVLILEDDVLWRVSPYHHDDDHCARHSYAASSYLVIGEYILTLLGNFQESLMKLNMEPGVKMYAIDVWWNRLMNQDIWFILTPAIVIQSSYPEQLGTVRMELTRDVSLVFSTIQWGSLTCV